MSNLYILFEHATGYAVFKVCEFEEVGMFLPQVEKSVTELSKFKRVVRLESFQPFKTAVTALENMNALSESIATDDLVKFLNTTLLQKDTKIKTFELGVIDPRLGTAINKVLGIICTNIGVVPEIIRGIRAHFHSFIGKTEGFESFTHDNCLKAQMGLGHAYSRSKVKFNVHKIDNMIIQASALMDQLDKDINLFSMRLREWYSYHFPELIKIVPENHLYAKLIKFIKSRKNLSEESLPELEEIVMDSGKAQAILTASRSSMGMDVSPVDLINIEMFSARVVDMIQYRKTLSEYLNNKMSAIAPNLAELIGEQVGARLISHAGSLTNLAKHPASTVQILGAEKALFRALKTKGNTPKYGLLFHSTFIGRAGAKNKGRISRYLANKCSIAARIDCFTEEPNNIFGSKLKEQVEDRLKFYDTGDIPKKNIDVMQEAIEIAQNQSVALKKKKRKHSEISNSNNSFNAGDITVEDGQELETHKKKKKRKHSEISNSNNSFNAGDIKVADGQELETPKKKKKNKKQIKEEIVEEIPVEKVSKKKKKKSESAA